MRRIFSSISTLFFASCIAFAQMEVNESSALVVAGLDDSKEIGGFLFVDKNVSVGIEEVILVEVFSEAANITFEVSDSDRRPVDFEQISDGTIFIRSAGKSWVDIIALDFEKNLFQRKLIVVENGPDPDPGPGPDPDPGPDPGPDPEIDNTYGLGLIAYKDSPDDGLAKPIGSLYSQAADFLVGRPTAKTIDASLDWLDDEITKKTGPSIADWRTFQLSISIALLESQRKKDGGFTKDDWYKALNEISKGLKAKQ